MTYNPTPSMPDYRQPNTYGGKPAVSGVAITAFIFSLILCIPFVTQLVGLFLGIIGCFVARKPNRSGGIFAILAVVISLLGLAGYGYFSYNAYTKYAAPFFAFTKFTGHLAQNDVTQAANYTAAPFDNARLPTIIADVKSFGEFKQFRDDKSSKVPFSATTDANGNMVYAVWGIFVFENASVQGRIELTRFGGTWKITTFDYSPISATTTLNGPTTDSAVP